MFDKNALYNGQALALNANWFEFADPVELSGNRDNPVLTYGPTINNREYLTVSAVSSGNAAMIYSHVDGPTDAPVFYSKTLQVSTSFAATSPPAVSAPGCTACMNTDDNAWNHSSSVFTFTNGQAYILSTYVLGDPRYTPSTQIVSFATNTATGASTALQFAGGVAGSGPLASEISMPLVRNYGFNAALIAYDHTRYDFYPGMKVALWNVDSNSVQYANVLTQGSLTPSNGDQNRWNDYIDAMTPIPNSSQILVGGTVASPSTLSVDSQRSTYYSFVTP